MHEDEAATGHVPPASDQTVKADETGGGLLTPGEHVGRYVVRERLGEGGFAEVYLAEQEEPVRRRVALKIIKPGMDTKQVIARFEADVPLRCSYLALYGHVVPKASSRSIRSRTLMLPSGTISA